MDAAEYNPNEWEAHVFELKTWEFAYGRKDPLPITPYDRLYSLVDVVQMEKLFEALQANTDEKQFRAVVDLIGDHPHWVRWGKSKALSAESMKYLDLPYLREVFASLGALAN